MSFENDVFERLIADLPDTSVIEFFHGDRRMVLDQTIEHDFRELLVTTYFASFERHQHKPSRTLSPREITRLRFRVAQDLNAAIEQDADPLVRKGYVALIGDGFVTVGDSAVTNEYVSMQKKVLIGELAGTVVGSYVSSTQSHMELQPDGSIKAEWEEGPLLVLEDVALCSAEYPGEHLAEYPFANIPLFVPSLAFGRAVYDEEL